MSSERSRGRKSFALKAGHCWQTGQASLLSQSCTTGTPGDILYITVIYQAVSCQLSSREAMTEASSSVRRFSLTKNAAMVSPSFQSLKLSQPTPHSRPMLTYDITRIKFNNHDTRVKYNETTAFTLRCCAYDTRNMPIVEDYIFSEEVRA